MQIFRVKSVKIYTGQKKFTRTLSVASVTNMRYALTLDIMFLPSYLWKENSDIRRSMNLQTIVNGMTLFSNSTSCFVWLKLTQDHEQSCRIYPAEETRDRCPLCSEEPSSYIRPLKTFQGYPPRTLLLLTDNTLA